MSSFPPPNSGPTPEPPRRSPSVVIAMVIGGIGCTVLAMVVALAAYLLPTFRGAKLTAVQSSCNSNLKQIGLAQMTYASDWDDRLPPGNGWTTSLMPYVKDRTLFDCPAVPHPHSGYAMDRSAMGRSLKSLTDPAKQVLVYDSSLNVLNSLGEPQIDFVPRHNGEGNLVFADGHTESLPGPPPPSPPAKP